MNGTKLNNEKEKNSFQEDDYIVMASYLASSTDTYEKMTKIVPPVKEEKHEKMVRNIFIAIHTHITTYSFNCSQKYLRKPKRQQKRLKGKQKKLKRRSRWKKVKKTKQYLKQLQAGWTVHKL